MWRRLAGRAHLGQSLETVAYRARNWKFESIPLQQRVSYEHRVTTPSPIAGDREFESISLQQRVFCELGSRTKFGLDSDTAR
jgi:hypothetical protein